LNAEDLIYLFGIFAIIMLAYGASIPTTNVQSALNNIFAPFPTFDQTVAALSGPQSHCGITDFGCQASQGVAQATAWLGAVFAWPATLGFSVINRVVIFGSLMQAITFGTGTGSLAAIPFGGLFLLALIIPIALYTIKIARGVAQGL
jgi:hypothetical protein